MRGGIALLFPLPDRSKNTLISIIRKYIVPCRQTIIYSDCWGGYFNNHSTPRRSLLRRYGYRHLGINHSEKFVSEVNSRIHTNSRFTEKEKIVNEFHFLLLPTLFGGDSFSFDLPPGMFIQQFYTKETKHNFQIFSLQLFFYMRLISIGKNKYNY